MIAIETALKLRHNFTLLQSLQHGIKAQIP